MLGVGEVSGWIEILEGGERVEGKSNERGGSIRRVIEIQTGGQASHQYGLGPYPLNLMPPRPFGPLRRVVEI